MKVRGTVVLENGQKIKWMRFCETEEEAIRLVLSQHPEAVACWCHGNRERMMEKGYRYLVSPLDRSFEPIYVKTLLDVADLLRDFPFKKFRVDFLEWDRYAICSMEGD